MDTTKEIYPGQRAEPTLKEMIDMFSQLSEDNQWRILGLGMSLILQQRGIQPFELDIPVELQVRGE